MTNVEKIAVSLPAEQVAEARRAVAEGRSPSVSAYVSAALASRRRQESLADLVAEWKSELGPPGDEDYEWARQVLGASPSGDSEAPGRRG